MLRGYPPMCTDLWIEARAICCPRSSLWRWSLQLPMQQHPLGRMRSWIRSLLEFHEKPGAPRTTPSKSWYRGSSSRVHVMRAVHVKHAAAVHVKRTPAANGVGARCTSGPAGVNSALSADQRFLRGCVSRATRTELRQRPKGRGETDVRGSHQARNSVGREKSATSCCASSSACSGSST